MNPEVLIKEYNSKAELVEFFARDATSESFLQQNNELKSFTTSDFKTFSVRMLVNGAWGYASTDKEEDLKDLFQKSYKLALNLSRIKKNKIIMKELPVHKDYVKSKAKTNPFIISEEEKINFIKDFNKSYKLSIIKSVDSALSFSSVTNSYLNSFNAEVVQEKNYTRLVSSIVASNAHTMLNKSVRKGYEFIKSIDVNKEVQKMETKISRLSNASSVKPGNYDLVVDPELAGTFFHEAVGHALEADLYKQKKTMEY